MLLDLLKSAVKILTSSLEYEKEYGQVCVTLAGEKVKSRGEKQIADYLFAKRIRYEYEAIARTKGWIFQEKISKPDFYLPDYNVYVEYWGLVNAQDYKVKNEYTRIMKWKMAQYHENKIKFISIYPDNLANLDWIFKSKFKTATGIDLNK